MIENLEGAVVAVGEPTRLAVLTSAFVACLLPLGCGPDIDPAPGGGDVQSAVERPPLPGETARARCEAFYEEGLAVEALTRVALRGELGEPIAALHTTEPNRHLPERTDTLWTLRYEGLQAEIRTAGGNDLLERVGVTEDRHLRFAEPRIGSPRAEVVERLGAPHEDRDGDLRYLCAPEPMPDMPVTFRMEGGRVAAIVWEYYVD